jgi:hypothetical protein
MADREDRALHPLIGRIIGRRRPDGDHPRSDQ